MIKLFVGGFPLDIDELELAQLLSLHGDISTIKIVRDKKTKLCKGYAFVEVINPNDAAQIVVALNGAIMKDRQLAVKMVEEKIAEPERFKPVRPANTVVSKPGNDKSEIRTKRPRIAK